MFSEPQHFEAGEDATKCPQVNLRSGHSHIPVAPSDGCCLTCAQSQRPLQFPAYEHLPTSVQRRFSSATKEPSTASTNTLWKAVEIFTNTTAALAAALGCIAGEVAPIKDRVPNAFSMESLRSHGLTNRLRTAACAVFLTKLPRLRSGFDGRATAFTSSVGNTSKPVLFQAAILEIDCCMSKVRSRHVAGNPFHGVLLTSAHCSTRWRYCCQHTESPWPQNSFEKRVCKEAV